MYAHTEESYILVIWLNTETYIVITPDKYLWQLNRDFTLSLPSGDTFLFSYIGTGASNTDTTLSEALRIFNSGCTIKGAFNPEYLGVSEFLEGIIVDRLLQVEGQSKFNGDIDIDGNVTINGDIKASSNAEINGALTVKGDIIQQGSSYETHAEKVYSKNDYIITRDGAISGLGDGNYTGIIAQKYNGTDYGALVFGNNGIARVGDATYNSSDKTYNMSSTQALATRENTPKANGMAYWGTDNKFITTIPSFNCIASSTTTSGIYEVKLPDLNGSGIEEGTTIRVMFRTGAITSSPSDKFKLSIVNSSGSSLLGAYEIYINDGGTPKPMYFYELNRDGTTKNWFVQPYTTLELMYMKGLGSGNTNVWMVIGNPVVLSSNSKGYTIYADGKIVYSYVQSNITLSIDENLDIPIKILKTALYEVCIYYTTGRLWFMGQTSTTSSEYLAPTSNTTGMTVTTLTENQKVFLKNLSGSTQTSTSIRVIIRTI